MNKKAIFDAVRKMLGRSFSQSEVIQLDALLDGSNKKPDIPSAPEEKFSPGHVSRQGIELLHSFEGCARMLENGMVAAYPDPGSRDGHPWTIGWGSTGPDVRKGTVWSKQECDLRFERDLERYAKEVTAALGSAIHSTSQAQFDALVSFHYNTGAIKSATLTRLHKAGLFEQAAEQFRRWNKNDGKVMAGLTRRRAAEEKLYRAGM